MGYRILAGGDQRDAVLDDFARAAAHWAGAPAQAWRLIDGARGRSFARGGDFYIYLEQSDAGSALGVARARDDCDVLRIALDHDAQSDAADDAALLWDDEDADAFLVLSETWLLQSGIADPFVRAAGSALIKRADIGARRFLMLGPLDKPRAADALIAIGGLKASAESDTLYPVGHGVERTHRARDQALSHLAERLEAAGYKRDAASAAGLSAELALSLEAQTLVFAAPRRLTATAIAAALGSFAIYAPREAGCVRILTLPGPHLDDGGALEPFLPALQELSVSVLFYDFAADGPRYWFAAADETLSTHVRAAVDAAAQDEAAE